LCGKDIKSLNWKRLLGDQGSQEEKTRRKFSLVSPFAMPCHMVMKRRRKDFVGLCYGCGRYVCMGKRQMKNAAYRVVVLRYGIGFFCILFMNFGIFAKILYANSIDNGGGRGII